MLRPVLRSHLPLRAKLALYKGYIRSRLTYAAPAWYALCSTTQRKRIQAQQSIALRMIVGAGRYVLNDVIARDLCIETVEEFIRRIARRMFDIADQGPHEFLRNIAPTHERSPSGRPLPREITKTPPPKQNRRGCFPDEKTPGHGATKSPPTRTYTHRHEGVVAPRTNANAPPQLTPGSGPRRSPRRGTAGSDGNWHDNHVSCECDRHREHLRQLTMPSRLRPMPTGANAGRPTCVCAAKHARSAPRPGLTCTARHRGRHGRAKRTGTAAPCAHRTLKMSDAARLPCVRRRGACPEVVETNALIANRRFGMLLADWIDHPNDDL
ncbi:hypothetical protein EVAR_51142_1 [Eumeta japonica]|uniref:Uncharacterized protein n=1 Tax=Eumeta variegata TaxID=151549 RepID=A0A4C1YQH1_EUMVA|nr:hypothetical protein EVAR_51142_1 [Eumeta japonica]